MARLRVIYRIYCKVTGKSYVGQTRNLHERKLHHIRDSKKPEIHSLLYRAVRKYGWENFEWSILQTCRNFKTMDKAEIKWIKKLDSFKNGYNLTSGGGFGRDVSEKTKKLISKANKGRPSPKKGRKLSLEQIEKMRIASTGKFPSAKTRLKMSLAHKGFKHSEEFKKSFSEWNKKRWKNKEYREKRETSRALDNNQIIDIYLRTREGRNGEILSQEYGVAHGTIDNIKHLKMECYKKIITDYQRSLK